jgi:hypothetical protein
VIQKGSIAERKNYQGENNDEEATDSLVDGVFRVGMRLVRSAGRSGAAGNEMADGVTANAGIWKYRTECYH